MARSKRSPAKVRPGKSLAGKQARQLDDTNTTVASLPFNANKAAEYGREHATVPLQGQHAAPPSDLVGASSLAEANSSGKTGRPAAAGDDLTVGPLDRLRVDATGQPLSTNQGVLVADNQHSLKAGLRGPALLKDFILREKITPVFVRFSTVAGERGSKDTARDARGFAVKFYTDEGNWDLQLRRARPDEARARGTRAGDSGGTHGPQSQSGQFLRRDRAGGVLHGTRGARHRLHQRSAAGGPHPFVRRHADLAPRWTELPRNPDHCAARGGAEQPA